MTDLFITGMLRSGTSLLQTLLSNHPDVFAAYQPFHQLYVDTKRCFLTSVGADRTLPLGDGLSGSRDETSELTSWLQRKSFSSQEAAVLIRNSVTGKGGSSRELATSLPIIPGTLGTIQTGLHAWLAHRFGKGTARLTGSKEVLCEEFLPYLLGEGRRCLLIVRDPRAVVASANRGRYREMVGDCYPTLMLVRLWRKSVAYALTLRGKGLHVLRYEDLVAAPLDTLAALCRYLDVPVFPQSILEGPLRDHTGQEWRGNSSFGEKASVDGRSTRAWEGLLAEGARELIEALCMPEMLAMGYEPRLNPAEVKNILATTEDDETDVRSSYLEQYRLNHQRRGEEIARWMALTSPAPSAESQHMFFLDGLRRSLSAAVDGGP